MLYDRQKRLLALVDALGGEVGSLDFQKLLFLYCKDVEAAEPAYEFVPYKYGGFSFTSYADKRRLTERGLLVDEERSWKITSAARVAPQVKPMVRMSIDRFARQHADLRGDALVAEAYRRHPYYATRSEMAARLFAREPAARAAIEAARPTIPNPGIYTIGYEGRSLEGYLNELLRAGVTLLCDVRRNALSRKYGFSRKTLTTACNGVGIRYEHLPELGIASDQRRELKSQADYDRLFTSYKENDLPKQGEVLEKIALWIRSGHRVALTCYEAKPCECHRHCVAAALEEELGVSFGINNL